jgi:phosphoesterase RecJ-like protein
MRSETRVALAIHENPDVDAVGAAAGMLDLFARLGVAATLHVSDDGPLPAAEYLPPSSVVHGLPEHGLSLYALDCGSRARVAPSLATWDGELVNIDHHADNNGYGTLALVDAGASSTSEIVCDIARALGLSPGLEAASALYAGISFDTGHFRHTSTGPRTFAAAAWLADGGVDVTGVFVRLYEQRAAAAVRLWGRAVAAARPLAGGRAMLAVVTRADYEATGASEHDADGIVESLRAIAGVEAAALVREQANGVRVRVSMRSDALDVSAVAALRGGGGHKLAAGFSSEDGVEEVTGWLSSELERRLSTASC